MPVNLPTIKSVEEARDALADVLQAAGRPAQIIGMMEKIMFCRAAEPRRFLSDALDGLIRGGLEELREKRRKALEKKKAEEAERAKELVEQIQETSAERREEAVEKEGEGAEDSDAPVPIVIVPPAEEITTDYAAGTVKNVMLHDGGWVRLRKIADDYDPTDRDRAYAYIRDRQRAGEIATGLLYISPDSQDVHDQNATAPRLDHRLPRASAGDRTSGATLSWWWWARVPPGKQRRYQPGFDDAWVCDEPAPGRE